VDSSDGELGEVRRDGEVEYGYLKTSLDRSRLGSLLGFTSTDFTTFTTFTFSTSLEKE